MGTRAVDADDADADSDLDSPPKAVDVGWQVTGARSLSGISRAAEETGKEGGPKTEDTGATRSTLVRCGLLLEVASKRWRCAVLGKGDPTSSKSLQMHSQVVLDSVLDCDDW